MKEKLRQAARDNLNNKKIVLFGVGIFGRLFYEEHKEKMNIVRCVSNVKEEWGEKAFLGKLDVSRFDINDIASDEYLIICGPVAFEQIEVQLTGYGLRMFYDFLDYRLVDALLEDKKVALFRGSCVLRDIYEAIRNIPSFHNQYEAIFAADNYTLFKYDKKIVYYIVQVCDLYIYSYRILRQDSVHIIGAEDLPEDCIRLSVSNISFNGFWPQSASELTEYNEYLLTPYTVKRHTNYYHMMYRDGDRNINELIEQGKDWEEIYQIISDEDFYSEKQIMRNLKVGFKSIEIAEKFADIKVLPYIREHYQDTLLFQDNMHMNKNVLWEYIKKIYEKLNLQDADFETHKMQAPEYVHHGGDQPIYPSVIKKLGLTWIDENHRYEMMTYYGVARMTFKEYVRHYVEYAQSAKEIMEMW